jgi:hypothetical protein
VEWSSAHPIAAAGVTHEEMKAMFRSNDLTTVLRQLEEARERLDAILRQSIEVRTMVEKAEKAVRQVDRQPLLQERYLLEGEALTV